MNKEIAYPQCYIIRDRKSEEAIWFVIIDNEKDDLLLKPHQQYYLNRIYVVDVTSLSEAETYGAFEIAPIGTCVDFIDWLQNEMDNIASITGNIMTDTNTIGSNSYPSFWLIVEKKIITSEAALVALVKVNNDKDNTELPMSWWNKFNSTLYMIELEASNYNDRTARREAPELNATELIKLVKEL
mgnify:CR=1 FL=1